MPLYIGNQKLTLYHGDHKPAELYIGSQKITGFHPSTQQGESLSFLDTYNDTADVKVTGKSEQVVTVQGKNLYANGNVSGVKSYNLTLTHPILPGTYTISAIVASSDVEANTSLVFFINAASVAMFNKALTRNTRASATFTLTETCTKLVFYASDTSAHSDGDAFSFTDIQLELGSVATAYEPFVPNSPSPDYPSPVLSFEGNVISRNADGSKQSSIAFPAMNSLPNGVSDEWQAGVLTGRIGKKVFDGTETWAWSTNGDLYQGFSLIISEMAIGSIICTHFLNNKSYPSAVSEACYTYAISGGNRVFLVINKSRLTGWLDSMTASQKTNLIKAYLAAEYAAGRPVTVWYQLATPTETPLAGQLLTYPHQTIIEQDGAVKGQLSGTCKVAD